MSVPAHAAPLFPLRATLLALALIATAVAGQGWQAWQQGVTRGDVMAAPPDLAQLIPTGFAAWREDTTLVAQPISAAAAAKAEAAYAHTLERVYVDGDNRRVMLSVTWGSQQGDRLQAHRPEFCYRAQGFSIGATRDATLRTAHGELPLRRVETRRPGRSEPVTYWMTVGSDAALPGLSRKLAQLRQGLSGQVPDGFLVRVSSISESRPEAFALQERFIADLLDALPESQRQRLAGRLPS